MQYFNDYHWQRISLRDLGLVLQLGHGGENCPNSNVKRDAIAMTVLDCNGVHDVTVMFCNCGLVFGMEATEVNQLIRIGWYPATKEAPRTVATFNVLDEYDTITCEGKISGYHFYKSLVRLTDVTLCLPTPVSLNGLRRYTIVLIL